ncbi:hypothetical protein V8G54_002791 [Vigna mungo]|uniref:Uncharacterized protein n=1 Tax=Vigna mungo TaxID=3915 RepID=A0AAQ3PC32_VIGMU
MQVILLKIACTCIAQSVFQLKSHGIKENSIRKISFEKDNINLGRALMRDSFKYVALRPKAGEAFSNSDFKPYKSKLRLVEAHKCIHHRKQYLIRLNNLIDLN